VRERPVPQNKRMQLTRRGWRRVKASSSAGHREREQGRARLARSYNPKLWIDPLMKEAAYPSV
jgi:hypothetical protein